jgi:hypothetical protein
MSENSQYYVQKPQQNCTFMNPASGSTGDHSLSDWWSATLHILYLTGTSLHSRFLYAVRVTCAYTTGSSNCTPSPLPYFTIYIYPHRHTWTMAPPCHLPSQHGHI